MLPERHACIGTWGGKTPSTLLLMAIVECEEEGGYFQRRLISHSLELAKGTSAVIGGGKGIRSKPFYRIEPIVGLLVSLALFLR